LILNDIDVALAAGDVEALPHAVIEEVVGVANDIERADFRARRNPRLIRIATLRSDRVAPPGARGSTRKKRQWRPRTETPARWRSRILVSATGTNRRSFAHRSFRARCRWLRQSSSE